MTDSSPAFARSSDSGPAAPPARRRWLSLALALACAAAGLAGGWLWQSQRIAAGPAGRLTDADRRAVEQVVQDYLIANPEILPQAMAELERKQNVQRLGDLRGDVERATAGTVLGNPQGRIVLVEFSDYACGFCRQSVRDVDALIAANPDLKVVVRELPILPGQSVEAARMAIAAAEQGRFAAFHKAMFAAGKPDAATIAAAAAAAGLDMDRARKVAAAPATEAELARNLNLARRLGFSGTPSWVVGDAVLSGAVGAGQLAEAIAAARS